jgi:hypothetical protein
VFFTVMGVIFLFDQLDILHLDLTLVLPIVLIGLGVVVVLGSRRSGHPPGGVAQGTEPPRGGLGARAATAPGREPDARGAGFGPWVVRMAGPVRRVIA